MATTWTTTRRMSPPLSRISICATPSTSAIRPAVGEAAHYAARHGKGRVAKLVLIGAVPPIMVKTAGQPGRPADRGVRRLPATARRQSRAVLPGFRERSRSTATTARARRCRKP